MSVMALTASPYQDVNAGGTVGDGGGKWGTWQSAERAQPCASCPPATRDRLAVRDAMREHALLWPPGPAPAFMAEAAAVRSVAGATAAAPQPSSLLSMSHADAPMVELYAHTGF